MRFVVNAVDARQALVALDLHAESEAGAIEAARSRGLTVISARPQECAPARAWGRAAAFPTVLFSIELVALLEAGLNLVEALQTLADKEGHGERQAVLAGILGTIRRGETFSQAVGRYPRHFPALYVATVKAAERTGDIGEALSRYVAYHEEVDRVRKKVVAASIYPAILMIVGTLVLAFLLLYVVPRFARVYADMSGTLPFFSAMLIAVGRGVETHGWLIAVIGACSVALGIYGASHPGLRGWLMERLWRLPALGERMKAYQLARVYRMTGMLIRAGIPAVPALEMVRDVLVSHLRPHLARARAFIEQGQPMSVAFATTGLATPVAGRMMVVGERSGKMGEMLQRIARFHDEETARSIEWFTRAFEPLLMAALGIAIGFVVVLMYMPIFELAGSIQ